DNTDIDLSRGEIDLDKAQLTPCPYLLFNYALPTSLQLAPKDVNLNPANRESYIKLARLPIFVVHSQAFATFLLRLGNLLVVNSKEISLKLQPEAI
ncbi:MAG TPA: hypothetical protein VHD63_02365, partial [Ktedonobacteraceae bacterium]|nr:hypothetical protein [Ktedonobacteraceae bacterium]